MKKILLGLALSAAFASGSVFAADGKTPTEKRVADIVDLLTACTFYGEVAQQLESATTRLKNADLAVSTAQEALEQAEEAVANRPPVDYNDANASVQTTIWKATKSRLFKTEEARAAAATEFSESLQQVDAVRAVMDQTKALVFAYGGQCTDADGKVTVIKVEDFAPHKNPQLNPEANS